MEGNKQTEFPRVGKGTKIWEIHLSNIHPNVDIGEDCKIHSHVWIGEGVKIGNNVKIQKLSGAILSMLQRI